MGSAVHVGTEIIDQMIYEGVSSADELVKESAELIAAELANEIERHSDWPEDTWRSFGRRGQKQDMAWWREVGLPNCVKAYAKWRLDNPGLLISPEDIEIPFDFMLGDVRMVGRIDRVARDAESGAACVIDIKSGAKPKTDEQLGAYRAALATQGIDVTYGAYLYSLKNGEAKLTAPINLSHWTAEKLHQVYGPAEQAIQRGIYMPNPGEACWLCDVADQCAFFQSVL